MFFKKYVDCKYLQVDSWNHFINSVIPLVFTACFIFLASLCTANVRTCVWICAVQVVSSGNQSSLNAAAKDTLHLTKIIIRRPLFCVTFWEVYSCGEEQSVYKVPCQTSPPSQRVILSLEDKPVLPGLQGLEKATCLSYKLVALPIETSHFCTTTEMQIYSDKSKWIPLPSQEEMFIPMKCWLPHGSLWVLPAQHAAVCVFVLTKTMNQQCRDITQGI